jgi:oligopeptide transport system substrate-binding protein
LKRKLQLRFFCLAIAGLLTVACGRRGEYFGNTEPPADNVFRFNNGAEPEYLDPQLIVALYDARIAALLFEGLTTRDPQSFQPRPGVAESWDISSDRQTYTFHLRPDARWSDGRPITAQDFVYSWTRALDPHLAARAAYYLYYIVNAEAFNKGELEDPSQLGLRVLDDHTLEVRLREPAPFFLDLISLFVYAPVQRAAVEQFGNQWTEPGHIVSNGPYLLREHRTHDRLEFIPNPLYWNARQVRIGRIIVYSIDDLNTAVNLYISGRVDWLPGPAALPTDFAPYLKGRFRDFHAYAQLSTGYFSFNVRRQPWSNPLVRRALSLAVDRRAITDGLLRKGDIPTARLVPPGFPGYPSPAEPEYNPQEAARLLAEAGYPNGEGFPRGEILLGPIRKKIAEAVQQMWAANLGIDVSVHTEEFRSQLKRMANHEFDLFRWEWMADFPDPINFANLLESTNGNNYTGWGDETYDRLLAQASQETDASRRMDLLYQAEAIAATQAPIIADHFVAGIELRKPYVKGIYPAPWDVSRFNEVWIDRQWKQHQNESGREE